MGGLLILLSIVFPIACGGVLFAVKALKEDKKRNIFVGFVLILSTCITLTSLYITKGSIVLWKITEKISFELGGDNFSCLFGTLMSLMFTIVGFYAMGYMEHEALGCRDLFRAVL